MTKKIILSVLLLFIIFVLFQYFNSGNPKMLPEKNTFDVVAHRGVHQNYHTRDMNWLTTCTASRIFKPTHGYLENTIESMQASFEMGATIIEIDIQRSSDDQIVVFHDWMLDCRTDGQGKVSDSSLVYLKTLDVGYGYTHDDGKTFPFRGKFVGKMPTLAEVFEKFPDKKFFLDHKDGSEKTAHLLVKLLKTLPDEQQKLITYWGPEKTYAIINKEVPNVTKLIASRPKVKKWYKSYILKFGLTGFEPDNPGQGIGLPAKYTKYIWGWPYNFLKKVSDAGLKFYLLVDTEEEAKKNAHLPVDGIITDYIEIVGPHYKHRIK